ncbi:hypothetical protein F7725_013072 [Dissostichus mawsoni]|uniref:Uncharacterized protein n=1 Tax=Dissostichus mawsoni TaxID=36200 RepID=A0A7J5YPI4_DISMA|nr:hypothetical protein F7725_013072 [Dissostichus mawsoni]
MVHQPIIKPSSPSFPHFTFKACVLESFALARPPTGQVRVTEEQEEKGNEHLLTSCTSLEPAVYPGHAGSGCRQRAEGRQPIPYDLVVDIIVEAIRQVPAQSGWILDGFPLDITQAFLLERALGGCVDEGNCVVNSRTDLAADPNPPEPPTPPPPVLDLALLLDIPEEIAGFEDTWPKLEDWFGEKQSILVRIDADVDEDELYKRMESVLQQTLMTKETQYLLTNFRYIPSPALATSPVEDVMLDSGKAPDSPSSAELPPVGNLRTFHTKPPTHTESETNLRHSRKASMSSVINEDSQGVPVNPPESLPRFFQLGILGYTFICICLFGLSELEVNFLSKNQLWYPTCVALHRFMCPHWDTVCDSYVKNVKTVMQQIRSQSSVINHHLFNIREDYKHYLGRPDLRQELVSHWQKDFNSIPDDMRKDEDTKAELHLRLDELRERLWDISDKCKEEDEQEKAALMGTAGWRNTRPDSKEKIQDQTEPVKLPQDKLISDYTEALRGISKLVSAEAHQGEMKEKKGKPQEKEKAPQASADANKNAKGKKSSADKKEQSRGDFK